MQSDGLEFDPGVNRDDSAWRAASSGEKQSGEDPAPSPGNSEGETAVKLRSTSELPAGLRNNPGRQVEGKVMKSKGKNEYLVKINGRQVTVETEFPLREGDLLQLEVGGNNSNELLLVGINPGGEGEVMTVPEARNLLLQMELPTSNEAVRLIRLLGREGGLAAREELADLLDSSEMLQDEEGRFSSRRVRSFLFLKQNQLPVSKELVDFLATEATDRVLSRLMSEDLLPRLKFDEGRLTEQLREIVNRLGIDLERQLAADPARASETIRARLAGIVLEVLNNEELKSSPERGGKNYGGLLRHSLASATEGQTLYLLVPFQTEEGTDFFQVRFQDERSEPEEEEKEKWSVRLKINLSRLGEIVVDARRREEKIKLNLTAAEAKTVSLLRKNKDNLREMLVELGYEPAISCGGLEDKQKDLVDENLLQLNEKSLYRLDLEA